MDFTENTTIAAICTAPGCAGIAIVRLSGPQAYVLADALCHARSGLVPSRMPAGTFHLFSLRDPADQSRIDEAIVLAFRAPHSYTGEDVVEFQTHGGRIAAHRTLSALLALGATPAGPGEFTRRAFLQGRIDLSQAEAVMDLIHAQSERAERMAVEQLEGRLGQSLNTHYDALMALCADVEASLDFADDESSDVLTLAHIPARLQGIIESLEQLAATWHEGYLLREGACVVLSGIPNAGKSTLFNALLGIFRAIVSDIPGTTRDTLEETLLLDGIPLRIIDTAGLREADSPIERMGVQRSVSCVQKADLNLRILDLSADLQPQLTWLNTPEYPAQHTLAVLNKTDVVSPEAYIALQNRLQNSGYSVLAISAQNGTGLEALRTAIKQVICGTETTLTATPQVAISERHHALIRAALTTLHETQDLIAHLGLEAHAPLCAQHLRTAAEFLAEITGRQWSEDLLDHVFSRFCIGK